MGPKWPRTMGMATPPVIAPYMLLLFLMAMFLFVLIVTTAAGDAFRQLGIPPEYAMFALLLSLGGSWINIPVARMASRVQMLTMRPAFFGFLYPIPSVETVIQETRIAVNLGGCVVPVAICLYLLTTVPNAFAGFLAATVMVTVICHSLARPVPGFGISIPVLIPPLSAAISAYVVTRMLELPIHQAAGIAYVSGVLGVLIGADLLNLGRIRSLGAPMVSIGGAGTFDGIFLTGILSVMLFPAAP